MRSTSPRLKLESLASAFSLSGIRKKLLCTVLIISLLALPGSYISEAFSVMASSAVEFSILPARWVASLFDSLKSKPTHRQRLSLTDRINQVSSIRVIPFKTVGYQGDKLTFSAIASNSSGHTVQGVRFSWQSSDSEKLAIDNTGQATLLQPVTVQVTCHAGTSQGTAHVLIRTGSRPPQTDAEWDEDQASLTITGQTRGSGQGSELLAEGGFQESVFNGPSASGAEEKGIIESLIDKLSPTVLAQSCNQGFGGDNSDFGYDELWNQVSSLTGNPRHRVLEGFPLGSINPTGRNFNAAFPIYGLGGRGLGAILTLYYNSCLWSLHGSAVTFNATQSWPSPGFSLGSTVYFAAIDGHPCSRLRSRIFNLVVGTGFGCGSKANFSPL